jgi:hypothetical protein
MAEPPALWRLRNAWKNEPTFFTNDSAKPTAWSTGFARHERVKSANSPITEKEAKAIRRLSKVAGKQSMALSGTIFGFLSNVNISVVWGRTLPSATMNTSARRSNSR